MHSTLYTVHCELQTIKCTVQLKGLPGEVGSFQYPACHQVSQDRVQCVLYLVLCTQYVVHFIVYGLQCTVYSAYCTVLVSGLSGEVQSFKYPSCHPLSQGSVQCLTVYRGKFARQSTCRHTMSSVYIANYSVLTVCVANIMHQKISLDHVLYFALASSTKISLKSVKEEIHFRL